MGRRKTLFSKFYMSCEDFVVKLIVPFKSYLKMCRSQQISIIWYEINGGRIQINIQDLSKRHSIWCKTNFIQITIWNRCLIVGDSCWLSLVASSVFWNFSFRGGRNLDYSIGVEHRMLRFYRSRQDDFLGLEAKRRWKTLFPIP